VGNRVALYNVTAAVTTPYLHLDSKDQAPEALRSTLATLKRARIADTNNTGIPIPWMLYFSIDDFQSTKVHIDDGGSYDLQMPCTSVGHAQQRIFEARPVFDRLAGDVTIAREYWQEAVDLLDGLPFMYIAMDHIEWLNCMSQDPEADLMEFKLAYCNGVPADDFLMQWSAYNANVKPYSHDEWDRLVKRFDMNNQRQMNAIAMGYSHSYYENLRVYEGIGQQCKGPTVVPRSARSSPTI
jgi:hypothetical protein